MAINDINAAGGITVKGQKHIFNLAKLDKGLDPTASVNNNRCIPWMIWLTIW